MPIFDLPLAELRGYRPDVAEPADFDAFWADTLAEARSFPGGGRATAWDGPSAAIDVADVTFPGYGGEPIRAWLTTPRGASGPLPCVVQFNGYGGGRWLPTEHLAWANAGYAHLFVDTRGQGSGWGSGGETPDPHGSGPAFNGFMTRGIASPATYFYRRVFTDGVRAVDHARGLERVDASRVAVTGGSQGGGIALAVAALHDGVAAVLPDVPFLCHMERAVDLTDAFPYGELVAYLAVHRDAAARVFATLAYFDGVVFARRIRVPALFSVALRDTICPPSTVFAAANSVPGGADVEVYPFNQHEGGDARHWLRQVAWLDDLFGVRRG